MPDVILAGDVGGTKTFLALLEPGGPPRRPMREIKLPSHDYPSLEALVGEVVAGAGMRPSHAVFGVAGPVIDNRCEATNLPWIVDGAEVGAALGGAEVSLLNDLEAAAWGLGELAEGDLEFLQRGEPAVGNRALIAAGTGLGEATLIWDRACYRPAASEGGHADFAPRNPLEDELLVWLRARYGRVSYERILSGPGLADLYRFLSATGRGREPAGMAERFAAVADPAAAVTEAALDGSCERARLAVETFVEVYAAEAGNLALRSLAVAGVFLGGGIAPRLLPVLRDGRFLRAFASKEPLRSLLERVPVAALLDDRTALWGAAAVALRSAVGAGAVR